MPNSRETTKKSKSRVSVDNHSFIPKQRPSIAQKYTRQPVHVKKEKIQIQTRVLMQNLWFKKQM